MAVFTRPKQHQGQDLRLLPGADTATLIENWRYDPDSQGWVADRGWEPLINFDIGTTDTWTVSSRIFSDFHSLYVWQNKVGTDKYIITEQQGVLRCVSRSKENADPDVFIIDSGRQLPTADYAGTQYVPYGRFLLIMNGATTPIKFYGFQHYGPGFGVPPNGQLPFGFTEPTSPVSIYPVSVDNAYKAPANLGGRVGLTPNRMDRRASDQGEWATVSAGRVPVGSTYYGLGSTTQGAQNTYSYRVSYVTDTGSESPLSDEVNVSWKQSDATGEGSEINRLRMSVVLSHVPVGPPGTVARRIYRTRRKVSQEGQGDLYWLVTTIPDNCTDFWIDTVPDAQLVTAAPLPTDSVVISQGYRYGCAWQGRMWLAGGTDTSTRIIYSVENRPEQFRAFDFFDVGTRDGGAITALFPFYDNLLVFRERAIDLITRTSSGFSITQLSSNIGTLATNSIQAISGQDGRPQAVLFLSYDGVYAFTGGTVGGATAQIREISQPVRREFERLNKGAMTKATSAYNPVDKEYWVHYPTDGSAHNNRGVVFHTENNQWSTRGDSFGDRDSSGILNTDRWRIQHMAWDGRNVLMGIKPGFVPSQSVFPPEATNLGLQVWSGFNTNGFIYQTVTNNAWQGLDIDAKLPSTYISGWHRLTDGNKVQILSIELEVESLGNLQADETIKMEFATDYDYEWTPVKAQPHTHSESYSVNSKEKVWGPATPNAQGFLTGATLGESRISSERLVRVRYDIHTGSVNAMRFKLTTHEAVHLVAYRLKFKDQSINTVEVIP